MAQQWQIEGPKVLDVGDEHERVSQLKVGVVGGRVDVVTHDDSPTARIEVTEVEGLPLAVSWDGGTLTLIQGKGSDKNVFDMIKSTVENFGRTRVRVSISVPVETRTTVTTVSADAVVSGLHARVKVNTVSGTLTLSDLDGDLDLNTISGNVECNALCGPLTVNAVSGTVTVQASDLPRVRITTISGDVALDLVTATSSVRSNSVSGDVTVRAPLSGFDVEGNTASGQVVVDGRQVSRTGGHGYGPHGHDKGGRIREGDGALQVKANAISGNIVVLRATGSGPASSGTGPMGPDGPQDSPVQDSPADDRPDDRPAVG